MSIPRSTKPEKGNKYYIRRASGGYSGCIKGKPTDPISDVLANCVGFCDGFINEVEGKNKEVIALTCNAENFIERAIRYGWSVVKEPVVGGVMVFMKGSTLSSKDGAGHVAGVYAKPNSTQVKTAESGYNGRAFWTATRNKGNGNWGAGSGYTYRGCIVPRYWKPTPEVKPSSDDKFNIGDKVVVNGPLYVSSNAEKEVGHVSEKITEITRKNPGSAHPYNTKGDLGWMDESSIRTYVEPTPEPVKPTPEPEVTGLQIGDCVEIIGHGNGSSNGNSNIAHGIGWTRYITKIYKDRPYPYQVGNKGLTDSKNTTGFYKETALRKK